MKKILGISLVAILAVTPLMAGAAEVATGTTPTHTDSPVLNNVAEPGYALAQSGDNDGLAATAGYVKGAYNAAIKAVNKVNAKVDGKQNALSADQMNAVNSGITSGKVATYDGYATGKQDALGTAQMNAVNSGITADKVATYDGYATGKQNALSAAQINAVNSGITSDKVATYDGYATGKQDTLSGTNKLNTDYIATSADAQFVTADEKAAWNGKQAALTDAQMNAVNSGITSGKVATYDGYATGKQDALGTAQLNAVNSGITSGKVSTYDGYATGKQNTLSTTNKLNTDYIATSANAQFVTETEKGRWDSKLDLVNVDARISAATGSVEGVSLDVSGTPTGTVASTFSEGALSGAKVSVPSSGTVSTLTTWGNDVATGNATVAFTNSDVNVTGGTVTGKVTSSFTGSGITSGKATGDITGIDITAGAMSGGGGGN